MTVRAAVVGCGDVSVVHLAAIEKLPGVELAGVCDLDQDRTRRLPVPAFTDHRRLLRTVRPDVVHVCTPHDQHVAVAVDCLEAGVDVLLEKPVAATVAEADRLIGAAAAHPDVKIGICLQNRYNATSRAARSFLRSDTVIGASATVLWHRDAAYYEARPWRGRRAESGGGVLINQAIHTLDLLDWLVGEVTDIRGGTGRYALDGVVDVEDTAAAVLDHAGGARSVFFATVAHAVDAPVTIEIVTATAVLTIRGDLTIRYADGRTEIVTEPAAGAGGRAYWGASHESLIADFYRTRLGPEPFWISPAEGARSLRLIDRLYQRQERTV